VLCGYLRMPYEPDPGEDAPGPQRLGFRASREVRHTVIRVITAHLQGGAAGEWQGLDFDFTGVVFDGGNFAGAGFSGGTVSFDSARFSGAEVVFDLSEFSEGTLDFTGAQFSGGTVDVLTAQFSGGKVDLSGAGDWSSPPAFSWGRTGTPARGVKLPKEEDQTGGQEQALKGQ
jgi:hypothetical protein